VLRHRGGARGDDGRSALGQVTAISARRRRRTSEALRTVALRVKSALPAGRAGEERGGRQRRPKRAPPKAGRVARGHKRAITRDALRGGFHPSGDGRRGRADPARIGAASCVLSRHEVGPYCSAPQSSPVGPAVPPAGLLVSAVRAAASFAERRSGARNRGNPGRVRPPASEAEPCGRASSPPCC
jgi:hypothetical protein